MVGCKAKKHPILFWVPPIFLVRVFRKMIIRNEGVGGGVGNPLTKKMYLPASLTWKEIYFTPINLRRLMIKSSPHSISHICISSTLSYLFRRWRILSPGFRSQNIWKPFSLKINDGRVSNSSYTIGSYDISFSLSVVIIKGGRNQKYFCFTCCS